MSLHFIKEVPTVQELQELIPMTPELKAIKKNRDEQIRKVFTGESDKFIMIIGPCSADNETAVLDYVTRLAKVQEEVKDKILIIPRIYTNKPRTTGAGYKGMLHQPDPEKAPDLFEGVKAIRKMHIDAIAATGMTAADEMLYSENWQYLEDILSYVAIGARSVEDQQHRIVTSGMDIPVGNEESNQWRFNGYDEFLHGRSDEAYIPLYRLGDQDRRKRSGSLYSAWCGKQARTVYFQLPL